MTVDQLLKLIPADTFDDLAIETKVDYQVKKLTGETVFKLILFSMLNSDKLSLRVMEAFLTSAKFKSFSERDELDSKYNSIRDRICTISSDYFEKLYQLIFTTYNKELKEEKSLSKADSTYVSLSAKLFSEGMVNGTASYGKKHVKYSVNLKGSLPCNVKIYTEQSYVSEDLALEDLIDSTVQLQDSIVVFDRGLQSRKAFDNFNVKNKLFVARSNPKTKMQIDTILKINQKTTGSTVTLLKDEIGYLFGRREKTKQLFRLIKGTIDSTGEKIAFVTNILDMDAYLIADLYKQRWEIEVFFKFLKQHLNVKHLVSRNINGIKVMIYMTMILAILILTYKKLNKIKGYKIAKLKFEIDLDNSIIKEIVVLCGGNPDNAKHLWNSS
jgi:hypothetical protein